jgi:long-chain acyl-CoA synthetase
MSVQDFLLRSTALRPEAQYVWAAQCWTSYSELCSKALRLARFLRQEAGVRTGKRVALQWENSAEAVVAFFGILIAGGVVVPVSTETRGTDLAYQLSHSEACALLLGPRSARRLPEAAPLLSSVTVVVTEAPVAGGHLSGLSRVSWEDATSGLRELENPAKPDDRALAAIVYTSGSTGEPKGVMLTHRNLVSNMHSIVEYLDLQSRDRVMMVLPHFYIYGLSLLLTHTAVGGSVVMDNRFMYPNTVLHNMVETEVTGFAGVPSTFAILLGRSTLRDMKFPCLRYVTQAGGAMSPTVQKEVASAFAPAGLYIMYGATEAAPRLSYMAPKDLPRKWGSIGKAIPGVELFVADGQGNRLVAGEEGELVARGPNITAGYWRDPDATHEVLRDGLYFTGDLGVEDADGFLFLTGRVKEIIKVKGFRVSPREIEERLLEIDGIAEAAVIGIPDEILGEAPVAYIVRSEGSSLVQDDIRKALLVRVAPYKVPVGFVERESLPTNASGKLDRQRILKDYIRSNG